MGVGAVTFVYKLVYTRLVRESSLTLCMLHTKTNERVYKMNTEIKKVPTIAASVNGAVLTLAFSNGRAIELDAAKLSETMRAQAMLHGLKQKLVDAAAISRNSETGRAASVDDKFDAVNDVFTRLMAGEWNATREGGGNAGGLLHKALLRVYPAKTAEQITEYLAKKTDAEKTALRANPKIATVINEIRAETGKAANIDTDALLGELGGETAPAPTPKKGAQAAK